MPLRVTQRYHEGAKTVFDLWSTSKKEPGVRVGVFESRSGRGNLRIACNSLCFQHAAPKVCSKSTPFAMWSKNWRGLPKTITPMESTTNRHLWHENGIYSVDNRLKLCYNPT